MSNTVTDEPMDSFTEELLKELFQRSEARRTPSTALTNEIKERIVTAKNGNLTQPIIDLFARLCAMKSEEGFSAEELGLTREELVALAKRHEELDEHGVTVGGRLGRALSVVLNANARVKDYMTLNSIEAPSGIQLWGQIEANADRIRKSLRMTDDDWFSFAGQLKHTIDSVETLAKVIDLPPKTLSDVLRVTQSYRMRISPYYASLIQPGQINDPVLIQCVPTGEMVDNVGEEIPPVASDHSPGRLIDQFYPRVATIKATNVCAMYCTHCLRIAHIGKKDRIYCREAYEEALDYIRKNGLIRDVLVTGGDAFMLPNEMLRWLLGELDKIDHVTMKRLGTRVPVTVPMRVDEELQDILEESNDLKPLRVVTQINTAQEVTPLSKDVFWRISKRVSAVLNQAVLLRGINDTYVKMWKLCETIQEAYVRPYYIFNCSHRNPQFAHLRVPVEKGRDIVESMYGNIVGDAIPRYIAAAGGKVPLHRDNVIGHEGNNVILRRPWSDERVIYPDADPGQYGKEDFSFAKYGV